MKLFLVFLGSIVAVWAPKPLYRDPVYDGAADPTLIYCPSDHLWHMFYTVRRANVPGLSPVASAHGTPIGIATSPDGAQWTYRGQVRFHLPGVVPDPSWWAPAVVAENGLYHLFVTYVPGTFSDWNHPRSIVHFVSTDLSDWRFVATIPLRGEKNIDPALLRLPDGHWRLWFKGASDGNSTHVAESPDLYHWTDAGRVPSLSDQGGEAPLAFHWRGHYWFLRDIAKGLALYRSDDASNWTRVGTLLERPGTGPDDGNVGKHPDVVVSGGRAFLFYFTQLGRRSSIQVVELHPGPGDATLTCDRDRPTDIELRPPPPSDADSKFE